MLFDKEPEASLKYLLSPWERELVKDVYLEFEDQGLEDGAKFSPPEQLQIVESSLRILIQEIRYRNDQQGFKPQYKEWRSARSRSIEALEAIGKSIGKSRKKCNISRLVGNCTSFVGGGVFLASAALMPFTVGLSAPLAVGGGLAMGLGSATSIGASVTELVLLKKKLQDATEILQQDREALKLLDNKLTSGLAMSTAIQSILAADPELKLELLMQILEDFVDSVRKVIHRTERIPLIRALVESLVSQFDLGLLLVASLVGLLLVLVLLLGKSEFGDVKKWKTSVKQFSALANVSMGLLGPWATIASKSQVAVTKCTAKAVTRGVVGVVGMTLDAASIVLTSIDLHKGSVSENSSKILDIARAMDEEACLLDEAYGDSWCKEQEIGISLPKIELSCEETEI